ncbi:MAG: hypothetical protein II133_06710 [Lachnospiraceae bacterium]|nr:hypothetical protein [Lachnospiraceae bacterium]
MIACVAVLTRIYPNCTGFLSLVFSALIQINSVTDNGIKAVSFWDGYNNSTNIRQQEEMPCPTCRTYMRKGNHAGPA